jgi:hypothetical protein
VSQVRFDGALDALVEVLGARRVSDRGEMACCDSDHLPLPFLAAVRLRLEAAGVRWTRDDFLGGPFRAVVVDPVFDGLD